MKSTLSQTLERSSCVLQRIIQPLLFFEGDALHLSFYEVGGEPITYEQAIQEDFTDCQEGVLWGRKWDTAWFCCRAHIPSSWAGKEVVALVDLSFEEGEGFGREGLVYREGVPVIAINRNRSAIPLSQKAQGGEHLVFYIEAAANPVAQMFWGNGDSLLADYEGERLFSLKKARLAVPNRGVAALKIDLEVLTELLEVLTEPSAWQGRLIAGINAACSILEQKGIKGVLAARNILSPLLAASNGSVNHQLSAIGHAHIDTAWVWPLRETIRKCARTFATMLNYMERYPDFVFGCSQPQQYVWMERYYPSIFEGIKKAVERGQWEVLGAMWVEPDCNIPSGESLVRQVFYGMEYFDKAFGKKPQTLWLPDVFGYSAALPQILKKSGINSFVTQKISWSDTNPFPHHSFLWYGVDGSCVFTHFPPVDTYNAQMQASELQRAERQFSQHDVADCSLLPYGNGDGGGGPTIEHIERARRWRDLQGISQVRMEKVSDFMQRAQRNSQQLPAWRGELYLELHRGTLTSQALCKKLNRQCEWALREAELWMSCALQVQSDDLLVGDPIASRPVWDVESQAVGIRKRNDMRYLERAWKSLLLQQFHDILPGSSIQWVYRDAHGEYQRILQVAKEIRDSAMRRILSYSQAEGSVVFNALAFARSGVFFDGDNLPLWGEVPSCGFSSFDRESSQQLPETITPVSVQKLDNGDWLVDNGLLSFRLNSKGCLTSCVALERQQEILQKGAWGNVLELYADYPRRWNAWDIDASHQESGHYLDDEAEITLLLESPLAVILHVKKNFGSSCFSQKIILRAASQRIDFESCVDWQESNRLLKVGFPLRVESLQANYAIAYGYIQRPTHDNTSWQEACFEMPCHHWADFSQSDWGVALINDSKYATTVKANRMTLTLLKASNAPDPEADRGMHYFSYALFVHDGGLEEGGVIEEARSFNQPIRFVESEEKKTKKPCFGANHSFISMDKKGVFLEALKPGGSDPLRPVVRLLASHQKMQTIAVKTSFGKKIEWKEVDLCEKELDEQAVGGEEIVTSLHPFEVKTFQAK